MHWQNADLFSQGSTSKCHPQAVFLLPGKHRACIEPDGKLATWNTHTEDLRAEVVSLLQLVKLLFYAGDETTGSR